MGTFSTAVLRSAKLRQQWLHSVCPQPETLQLMFWARPLATFGGKSMFALEVVAEPGEHCHPCQVVQCIIASPGEYLDA